MSQVEKFNKKFIRAPQFGRAGSREESYAIPTEWKWCGSLVKKIGFLVRSAGGILLHSELEMKLATKVDYLNAEVQPAIKELIDNKVIKVCGENRMMGYQFIGHSTEDKPPPAQTALTDLPLLLAKAKDASPEPVKVVKPLVVKPAVKEKPMETPVPTSSEETTAKPTAQVVDIRPDKVRKQRRSWKRIDDKDFLEYIRLYSPTSTDIMNHFHISSMTAATRTKKLQDEGLIHRLGRIGPWTIKIRDEDLQGSSVVPNPVTVTRYKVVPDPVEEFEQNFQYVADSAGGLIVTGLKHHKRVHLTADEIVKMYEAITMSPLEVSRQAMTRPKPEVPAIP